MNDTLSGTEPPRSSLAGRKVVRMPQDPIVPIGTLFPLGGSLITLSHEPPSDSRPFILAHPVVPESTLIDLTYDEINQINSESPATTALGAVAIPLCRRGPERTELSTHKPTSNPSHLRTHSRSSDHDLVPDVLPDVNPDVNPDVI